MWHETIINARNKNGEEVELEVTFEKDGHDIMFDVTLNGKEVDLKDYSLTESDVFRACEDCTFGMADFMGDD